MKNTYNVIIVRTLAVILFMIGVFAFVGSIFLWGKGFILDFPKDVDYVFPITDLLINVPTSIIAAIGLWRNKKYGYVASQIFSGFGLYASVEIFVKVFQGNLVNSAEIMIPQIITVILALILIMYLWKIKDDFK
jgi:hypothetical protein